MAVCESIPSRRTRGAGAWRQDVSGYPRTEMKARMTGRKEAGRIIREAVGPITKVIVDGVQRSRGANHDGPCRPL